MIDLKAIKAHLEAIWAEGCMTDALRQTTPRGDAGDNAASNACRASGVPAFGNGATADELSEDDCSRANHGLIQGQMLSRKQHLVARARRRHTCGTSS